MLIHEVACSLVVWYSKGTCDGPERGGIKKEGGQYVEERLWDGVSDAEFSKESSNEVVTLEHVGTAKNGTFYPIIGFTLILNVYRVLTLMIDDKIKDILQLDISSGLPLLGISNLTPMPPTSGGLSRSKFMDAVNVVIQHPTLIPHNRQSVQRHSDFMIKFVSCQVEVDELEE